MRPVAQIAALRQSLMSPKARYVACCLAIGSPPPLRRNRKVWWKGVMACSKLLGCTSDQAALIMGRVGRTQSAEFLAFISGECPENAVGEVYTVQNPEFPGVIKLGFSTNLERRVKQLEAEHKVSLEIVSRQVGTYLDEFICHRSIGARWLAREWFGSEENPEFCPPFLLAAGVIPRRMLTATYIEAFTGEPAGPLPNIGPFLTEWEAEQALHASLRSNPKALS